MRCVRACTGCASPRISPAAPTCGASPVAGPRASMSLRHHPRPQLRVGRQHPVVPDQVQPRPRHPCRQPLHEVQRTQHQVRRSISPRCLEPERHLACRVHLDALVRQRRSRDVAAQLAGIEPCPTTTDLVPYAPEYLRGWTVERYRVDLQQAAARNLDHRRRQPPEVVGSVLTLVDCIGLTICVATIQISACCWPSGPRGGCCRCRRSGRFRPDRDASAAPDAGRHRPWLRR